MSERYMAQIGGTESAVIDTLYGEVFCRVLNVDAADRNFAFARCEDIAAAFNRAAATRLSNEKGE